MRAKLDPIDIVHATLGTFDYRHPLTPGMFEPLKPVMKKMGYTSAAIYIADDYPDRMQLICGYGGEEWFPDFISLSRRDSLFDEFTATVGDTPDLMAQRLFSHGRELGVLAVTHPDAESPQTRELFDILAKSVSMMSYLERISTNHCREREERDIFFAQSLTNRLLIREAPKMKELRLGFEFLRSLEAGGDFFDLIPCRGGNLMGFFGCVNGNGLRTVLEIASIMRSMHRSFHSERHLSGVLKTVNELLVEEKHRAHQASLCVFYIDVEAKQLRLAKAGRLLLLLCQPDGTVKNVSAAGATFLGMVDKPQIRDEEYEFIPGASFLGVTEGFYASHDAFGVRPQVHWFLQSLELLLAEKRSKPLANAIFDLVNRQADHTVRPDVSMLAISAEFLPKK